DQGCCSPSSSTTPSSAPDRRCPPRSRYFGSWWATYHPKTSMASLSQSLLCITLCVAAVHTAT
ncbi:unnamed protein product, partial [Musa acuminata var. zebrina]